jgi:transposase InsO family protein
MLVSPGKLNAHAKRTLVERVVFQRLPVAEAARMANISRQTAHRWIGRYRRYGWDGLNPRSRRPHTCPRALPESVVEAILTIRVQSGRGPQWIGWRFALPPSTVHRVLRRWNLHKLKWLDRVARTPVRYERAAPGELLHLDVKKLQRVPPGGGRHFDPNWKHDRRRGGHGFDILHVAIDDYSRYLYVEALPDEKGPTTVAFLERALSHFASLGVSVQRILTDNGMNYRSNLFRRSAQERGIALKRTRPYRPQTNGKAERVIQTLLREWAYQRHYDSNDERLAALRVFIEEYNTRRPHMALGRRPPISRLNL